LRREQRLLLLALALASVAACGGKVVVDGAGAEAGGGGSQTTSSTGSGVDPAICTQFCDAEAANGCLGNAAGCAVVCQKELANVGICADELIALFACDAKKAAETAVCSSQLPCPELATAFDSCVIPGSDVNVPLGGCTVGQGCDCMTSVNGDTYASDCTGPDPVMCTCTKNDQLLGTCAAPVPDDTNAFLGCDLYLGCCAKIFAVNH
jgi:hypothetical protein